MAGAGTSEAETIRRIESERLKEFIQRVFMAVGVPEADAGTVAEVLVGADLRGGESHGSTRVAGYVSMIRHGLLNPTPKVEVLMRVIRSVVTVSALLVLLSPG